MARLRSDIERPTATAASSSRCVCDGRLLQLCYRLRVQGEALFIAGYGRPCRHVLGRLATWPEGSGVS